MLTPEEIADLRARAQAATPGTWSFDPVGNVLSTADGQPSYITGEGDAIRKSTDLAYIAAANPATVLQLLDMIERLEKEADWLADNLTANCNSMEECYTFCPGSLKRWGCHAVTVSDWREAARKVIEESK